MQKRMEQRRVRRTAPARAATATAEVRELAGWVTQALSRGFAGDVVVRTREVMAAHQDAGPASDLYMAAWLHLATALAQLGQHAEAVREYGGFIEAAGSAPGGEVMSLRARLRRAGQLALLGRFDEAEAECQLITEQCAQLPSAPAATAMRLIADNTRTIVLSGRGQHAEAESLARSALREASSADLPPHGVTAFTVSLARTLTAQQRYGEAELALRDLRPDGPAEIVTVACGRAAARLGQGRLREAEAGARDALAAGERVLGPLHYTTLHAGTILGAALARQGRHDEAERVLRANLTAWTAHFGPGHPRTTAAQEELARTGAKPP
jgi:tetratricopeptide (TPR) repeat protein